jgi:C4-dicarboxylate transporter, DctM subunit
LGCFVEGLGMIVMTIPLLYPVLVKYGVDLIWFGVLLVVLIEMGQITPPIGINLFIIQSISKIKFGEILIGVLPFVACIFVLVVILMFYPSVALWLPEQMFNQRR